MINKHIGKYLLMIFFVIYILMEYLSSGNINEWKVSCLVDLDCITKANHSQRGNWICWLEPHWFAPEYEH